MSLWKKIFRFLFSPRLAPSQEGKEYLMFADSLEPWRKIYEDILTEIHMKIRKDARLQAQIQDLFSADKRKFFKFEEIYFITREEFNSLKQAAEEMDKINKEFRKYSFPSLIFETDEESFYVNGPTGKVKIKIEE